MIKLTLKSLFLSLIVFVFCVLIVNAPIRYKHNLAIIIDRFEMMSSKKGKKIALIGGSGLSVGINSQDISTALDYDVINLGIYAGYGINFLLEKSKQYLKPNDVIVVIPEFGLLLNDKGSLWPTDKDTYKWLLVVDNYLAIRHLYLHDDNFKLILRDISELGRDRFETVISALAGGTFTNIFGSGRLDKNGFNVYGDVMNDSFPKIGYKKFEDHGIIYSSKGLSSQTINELNQYATYYKEKGIVSYFMYSCFPQEEFILNRYQFFEIHKQLTDLLKMSIIGNPSNFVFPSVFFSNTANHLTGTGKKYRTQIMVDMLSDKIGIQKTCTEQNLKKEY